LSRYVRRAVVSETAAIVVTLVVYQAVLLAIGVVASRRTADAGDYFLGGRQLGPWVASLSASASSSSAWTLLGVSGAAYSWGVAAVWIFPACVGGFALNWYVLAPRLRRLSAQQDALTVTDLVAGPMEEPGSLLIRRVATAIVLLSLLAYVASQFQGAGKTFSETFDLSMPASVLIGSAIVIAYTMLGGFWAVSVTDMVQGLVMATAAVALPWVALTEAGGASGLVAAIGSVDVEGYASLTRNMATPAAVGFTLGLLGIGLGYPGQPHVVNRFMAMRDEAAIVTGRRIAIGWAVIIYSGMIVLGLSARALFGSLPDGEVAFVVATRELFPPIVAGVMLAAVLSAIMSTADSQLLVAASSVAHDLDPERSDDGATVRKSRLVVLGLSAAAIVAALIGDATIFDKVLFAWSAMGAAFGPLLLVLVVIGPVRWEYRLAAISLGFFASVLAYWIPGFRGTAWERVLPFVLAGVAAWRGSGVSTDEPA
jgi:sodium/proline symporter